MLLKKWEDLPSYMKCDEVRTYYDILSKRKISLVLKRFFDVVVASIMLIILANSNGSYSSNDKVLIHMVRCLQAGKSNNLW